MLVIFYHFLNYIENFCQSSKLKKKEVRIDYINDWLLSLCMELILLPTVRECKSNVKSWKKNEQAQF